MIDLDDLEGLCPGLPAESASTHAVRARVALGRRHAPGVALQAIVGSAAVEEELRWTPVGLGVHQTQDQNRVTEEGAVAIALALAGRHHRWRVLRCLQSRLGEGADWLLEDPTGTRVALEVGGTDEGSLSSLLKAKQRQARESIVAAAGGKPAACVVRFVEPKAILWSDDDPR